jgi:hypothetical protein
MLNSLKVPPFADMLRAGNIPENRLLETLVFCPWPNNSGPARRKMTGAVFERLGPASLAEQIQG